MKVCLLKGTGIAVAAIAASTLSVSPASAAGGHGHKHKAVSRLFGSSSMQARAMYAEVQHHGQVKQKLMVHLNNAEADQDYDVFIDDVPVGSVHTNEGGCGDMIMRTGGGDNSNDEGDDDGALPDGFPTLGTGDTVSVGEMAGVFFDHHPTCPQHFELQGGLDSADDSGASGEVDYKEVMTDGGLRRFFSVEVDDAMPGESMDVVINDQVVGTMTADEEGHARTIIRTGDISPNDANVFPMPPTFPSLHPGDMVMVGSMTATMSGDCGDDDGDSQGDDGAAGDDGDGTGDAGGDAGDDAGDADAVGDTGDDGTPGDDTGDDGGGSPVI